MDWQQVQATYPINDRFVWLNNCGTTPPGRHVVERMHHYFESSAKQGPGTGEYSRAALLDRLQRCVGELLGADADEIALIHNTAEGMTMVALGLDLRDGDEVLLLADEYPSNVYPWQMLEGGGVKLRFVPMTSTPAQFIDSFRSALTPRTGVAALSAVHWCTGMPLPLEEAAAICRERGIRFVVDGSQGVGQVALDMRRLGPCAVASSAWKWLLGPLGLGVLAVSRELLAELRPVFKGPDAVADPTSYLPYQAAFNPTAGRYMYSTANFNDWVYLAASLDLLQNLGFERVQARIHELTALLWEGLESLGFESAYDRSSAPGSGILAVHKTGVDSSRLVRQLAAHGIVARERLGNVRLAPHIYVGPEQISRVIDVFAKLT